MWEISEETCFAAAHQLRSGSREGERLHSHNWRVKAVVQAKELDRSGWVFDFDVLGATLRTLVKPYVDASLNAVAPFDDLNPTAENLARVVADNLAAKIDDQRVHVARVEVWKNETCCAVFFRG